MHRSQAILDAILVRLENIAGLTLIRNEASLNRNFPAVRVKMGADNEIDFCPKYQVMAQDIEITIFVQDKNKDDLDKQILTTRERVHKQIMAVRKLGKPYVQHLRFVEQSAPEYSQENDIPTGECDLTLEVHYISPLDNPSEV